MGSFSWYASDTHRAIRSQNPFPVYALRPDGPPLLEDDYCGYGEFGGHDIYDLLADWNRKYLAEHPEFMIPQHGYHWSEECGVYVHAAPQRVDEFQWYPMYADLSKSREEIEQAMQKMTTTGWEYRYIGIEIGCYDDQNRVLPYPIKLVEYPVPYAAAAASNSDPEQGWGTEDRFEPPVSPQHECPAVYASLDDLIADAREKTEEPENTNPFPDLTR